MLHRFSHALSRTLALAAAFFLIAVLLLQLAGIVSRLAGWPLEAADAYAGYCLAAASFFAMGAALYQGDHIRVSLGLQRLGTAWRWRAEVACLAIATFLCGYFVWFACRLVWTSWEVEERSPNLDATLLWIPQLSMALGLAGLFLAFVDLLWRTWRSGTLVEADPAASIALE